MVPVGISISYLSNGRAHSSSGPVRARSQPAVSTGASPAAKQYTRNPAGLTPGRFGHPPGPGLVDLGEVALAQPQVLRGHLEELVVGEEIEGLLEAQPGCRREADRHVGGRRADVRLLLLAAHVHADVAGPLLDPHDHPLVDLFAGLDECRPPLLRPGQPIRERRSWRGGGQSAIALLAKLADKGPAAAADVAHQPGARRDGQECVAKPDQAPRRDHVLEARPALLAADHPVPLPPPPPPRPRHPPPLPPP